MNGPLSTWLVAQMQARGISQADFARKSGISQGLVSQAMNHGKPLPMDRHTAVLKGLGIPVKDEAAEGIREELRELMQAAKAAAASKPVRDHADTLRRRAEDLEQDRDSLRLRVSVLESELQETRALLQETRALLEEAHARLRRRNPGT